MGGRLNGNSKAIVLSAAGLLIFACASTDVPTAQDQAASSDKRTPFTLSLIGQAERMAQYTLKPDLQNATDLAYCAVITGDDVRAGAQPFMERLRALVGDEEQVQRLISEAALFEREAIDYARSSDDLAAALYYNSGWHSEACQRAINPALENPNDCAEAFKKNDVPVGIRHSNTHESSVTYDGRYFATLVWDQARNIITVFDLDAQTRRGIELSDTRFTLNAPSISADGKWIALQAMRTSDSEFSRPNGLLIVPVDGGHATYISSPGANYGPPAISPRGDKVFYAKYDTGYREPIVDGSPKRIYEPNAESRARARKLYELDLTTGTERRLSDQPFQSVLDPVYAPDGQGVVFRFMYPIGPSAQVALKSSAPPGTPYSGNYWTYFEFGSDLPLWPAPVAPLDIGRFSTFGPDGTLYGFGWERLSTTDPETGEKRNAFRIWRKAAGAEKTEIIDRFDRPQAPDVVTVAGGTVLPESSTFVSLARRELRCFKPGARKYSDPFIRIDRRGVPEHIPLDQFSATRIGVLLPE